MKRELPTSVRASTPQLRPTTAVQRGSARARLAGHSWADIGAHIANKRQQAKAYGYSDQEIDHHLGFRDPKPAEDKMRNRALANLQHRGTLMSTTATNGALPKNLPAVLAAVAKMGEGRDRILAHLSPGDVIFPVESLEGDDKARKIVAKLFNHLGLDPERWIAGHKNNQINKKTGLREFDEGEGSSGGQGDAAGGSGGGSSGAGTGSGDSGNSGTGGDPSSGGHQGSPDVAGPGNTSADRSGTTDANGNPSSGGPNANTSETAAEEVAANEKAANQTPNTSTSIGQQIADTIGGFFSGKSAPIGAVGKGIAAVGKALGFSDTQANVAGNIANVGVGLAGPAATAANTAVGAAIGAIGANHGAAAAASTDSGGGNGGEGGGNGGSGATSNPSHLAVQDALGSQPLADGPTPLQMPAPIIDLNSRKGH